MKVKFPQKINFYFILSFLFFLIEIEKLVSENNIKLNFHVFKETFNEKSYFCTLNNWERDIHKSGIYKIRETISSEYNQVENGVKTNLKHYLVIKEIEKLSKNKMKEIENPFVEISFLVEQLNQQMEEESKEAAQQIEPILVDLHKLGVIIYFNNEILKDTIITSPFWFNKVFKVILDHGRKKIGDVLEFTLKKLSEMKEKGKMKFVTKPKNSEQEIRKTLNW